MSSSDRARLTFYPVGPRVTIEVKIRGELRQVSGYEPPPGYEPGIGEVVRVGRRVTS